jgi:hypothetical protein
LSIFVEIDFGKDDLLADDRASSCHGRRRRVGNAAEVAHARQREVHQAVEKLVHALAAQVTMQPIAMFSRSLKFAMALRALVTTGFWPAIAVISATADPSPWRSGSPRRGPC